MTKFWQLMLLGSLAWAIPSAAWAQSLGLNFAATDPDAATSSLLPTEVAGVVSQANWNNFAGATGASSPPVVYDNSGTAVTSTATVSWNGPNTWRSSAAAPNQFPAGPNRKLMSGYLDSNDTSAGASMVTVNNIDATLRTPSYDVYVYFLGDSAADRGGGYTLTPTGGTAIVKYGSTMASATMHVEDPGTDVNNSMDGTYLKFTGLNAASFSLTGDATLTTPNGFRAPINAVQIVRAGAVPGDVNGDGQVNVADFHVIRGNLFKTGQTRGQGDLVGGDGIVDFRDYREWKVRAGAGVAASVSLFGDAVPEPSSCLMLAIVFALAGHVRRRSVQSSLRWAS